MAEKERAAAAAGFKEQGNALYREKRFLEAAVCYTRAIQEDPGAPATWTNRAAAYLELAKRRSPAGTSSSSSSSSSPSASSELQQDVLRRAARDAAESTRLDASWEKGHLRLSAALEALGSPGASLWALTLARQKLPGSKELSARAEALRVKYPQAVASSSEADALLGRHVADQMGEGEEKGLEEELQWLQAQIASQEKRSGAGGGAGAGGREADNGASAMERVKRAMEQTPAAKDHPGRKHIHFGPMPPVVRRDQRDSDSDDDAETDDGVMVRRPGTAAADPPPRQKPPAGPVSAPAKPVSDPGKHRQHEAGAGTARAEGTSTAQGAEPATPVGSGSTPGVLGRLASLFGFGRQAGAAEAERAGPGADSRNKGDPPSESGKGSRAAAAGQDRLAGSSRGAVHSTNGDRSGSDGAPAVGVSGVSGKAGSGNSGGGMAAGLSGAQPADKIRWARALGEDRMYEWFLDCYRFQESGMDATNAEFHAPACGRLALLPFLLFCKLARDRGVVPPQWNWRTFLTTAREDAWRKLSHDEALRRYGRMVMVQHPRDDSPNMIATAEHVYECRAGERMPEGTREKLSEVSAAFYEFVHGNETDLFDDMGGEKAWRRLSDREPALVCKCKRSSWARQFDPDYNTGNQEDSAEDRWDSRWECKDDWARLGDGETLDLE